MQKESENQRLLEKSEISLWLDTYDDIFSDFDPRPYSQRALSEDFLNEAKRASRDKLSGIELKFLVKKKMRSSKEELLVRKRLRNHFNKHHNMLEEERARIMKRGAVSVIIGIILMFVATFVLYSSGQNDVIRDFFIVLLEPAGWFLFWEGLNNAMHDSKKIKPDLEFYKKMSRCHIEFLSY